MLYIERWAEQYRLKRKEHKTYSGVNVTPVTSSASTIDTSGTTASGSTLGFKGGGVGGVDDLDRDNGSLAIFTECIRRE